jgi:hypothetical protein
VYYNKSYEAERALDEGQNMKIGSRCLKLMCPHIKPKGVDIQVKKLSVLDRIKKAK